MTEQSERLQWRLVYVYLDPVVGREQAGNRPALIVSDETCNEKMEVVTILPITTRKSGRRIYPNKVLLIPADSGLKSELIAMAHQIRTISRRRIKPTIHRLTSEKLQTACIEALNIHLRVY